MKLKTLTISSILLAFTFTMLSCANEKNDQDGKDAENEALIQEQKEDSANQAPVSSGTIALDKLPAGVNEYVNNNFSGYTVFKAASDPLCQGGDAIDVAISKSGSPNYSLIFKPDGSFVQLEEDVDLSKAPGKILEVVKNSFPGYQPAPKIEKLTLANKKIQYLLDLTKDGVAKEVIFNSDGTIDCEK